MGVIRLLPPLEAQKIAAGEVVDRPAAIVREFIDNAIDSGADLIELSIEAGGTKCVEVSDNGSGIAPDDLKIACKAHATSKIRSLDDLSHTRTMGFRGEALAAAAAVSELEIISSCDGKEAWRFYSDPAVNSGGDAYDFEAVRRVKGTSVRAKNLFKTMPPRKRFLKRDASEAMLCRQVFLEKAMPFPSRAFRFTQDGALKLFFPASQQNGNSSEALSYKKRFGDSVLRHAVEQNFLHEIHAKGEGFSISIVIGGPEIYREHRREQFIFANCRRINDYSLQQALEYGSQGAFPNGCHPIGAVFIDIEPHLADFNVHPAKREAKFVDSGAIHHAITHSLRMFFHNLLVSKAHNSSSSNLEHEFSFASYKGGAPSPPQQTFTAPAALKFAADAPFKSSASPSSGGQSYSANQPPATPPTYQHSSNTLRYIGYAFKLFLLVERDGKLYALDQHAAHERILYNNFITKPILKQELLVPIPFTTETKQDDDFLNANRTMLEKLGIVISGGGGAWRIDALPALWRAGNSETIEAILNLKNSSENIAERWASTLACHSALRDGEMLDNESALQLAEKAFTLEIQNCPHGRPIITEIKKEELLKAVRRL